LRRLCLAAAALCACTSSPFEGLAPARDEGGPKVRFDLRGTPLPEIPFPNDLATRTDAASPTGLRLNASLFAPTGIERDQLARIDTLDGFGTFAPITVGFDKPLDILDLYARQNDSDPANDGAYLIDLADGGATPLDFGSGRFPYTTLDPTQYFPFNPDPGVWNLLFPVSGPLANFLHPELPHGPLREQADDLLTFYERETNTLILRPVLPLRPERRYALVLTNRIRGADGRPIASPHSGINHAAQTQELQPLLSRLPAGTPLEDVAYVWAFTTQSISRDLELIRSGLAGAGPLQLLSFLYAVQQTISSTVVESEVQVLQESGAFVSGTATGNPADYILAPDRLAQFLSDPAVHALPVGSDPAETAALLDTWKYVDYFVSGSFTSPGLLEGPGGTFHVDSRAQTAGATPQRVAFFLAVPKERREAGHLAPFPVVLAGHGIGSHRFEPVLAFGGTFAKFGVATLAIDAYGHGFALSPAAEAAFRAAAATRGLDAFADAMLQGRARDLDGDGVPDSGGDAWTGNAFHTRDVVRQTVLDWVQAVRLLRTFDGRSEMLLGNTDAVAGDFNNDGVPDIASAPTFDATVFAPDHKTHLFERGDRNPGADLFAFGTGFGGTVAAILPAIEPAIVAAAPVSPAGGLTDLALRTTVPGVVQPLFLDLLGPVVAACGFSSSLGPVDATTGSRLGACASATDTTSSQVPMLVLAVREANHERDLPLAPLALAQGQQVLVRNLARASAAADCRAQESEGCAFASADAQGRLRIPMPSDAPASSAAQPAAADRLQIVVFDAAGAEQVRIDTFGMDVRFSGVDYKAGTPLVAPASGFGLRRNTPAFRRMIGLTQLILDPADPVNYVAASSAKSLLLTGAAGDRSVPVSATIALARAAGLVPMETADPDYGIAIDQVLIRGGTVEGVAESRRFDDPAGGAWAALPGHVRCDPGADCTGAVVADPAGYSCGASGCSDGLQAPRLDPPLRQQLVRQIAPAGPCPVNQRAGASGCYSTGASACNASSPAVSALLLPLFDRTGARGLGSPKPGNPFDMDQFIANAGGRFFECRGRELRFDECQQDLARCPWIPPPPP
jgi:hypothetical protein